MEDRQKVYIKGDRSRGDEIIKLLEDLGGKILFLVMERMRMLYIL